MAPREEVVASTHQGQHSKVAHRPTRPEAPAPDRRDLPYRTQGDWRQGQEQMALAQRLTGGRAHGVQATATHDAARTLNVANTGGTGAPGSGPSGVATPLVKPSQVGLVGVNNAIQMNKTAQALASPQAGNIFAELAGSQTAFLPQQSTSPQKKAKQPWPQPQAHGRFITVSATNHLLPPGSFDHPSMTIREQRARPGDDPYHREGEPHPGAGAARAGESLESLFPVLPHQRASGQKGRHQNPSSHFDFRLQGQKSIQTHKSPIINPNQKKIGSVNVHYQSQPRDRKPRLGGKRVAAGAVGGLGSAERGPNDQSGRP